MKQRALSFEKKYCELIVWFEEKLIYGLMGISFGLFFVRLNHIVEYIFFGLLAGLIIARLINGTLCWLKTSLDIPILLYLTWTLIWLPFAVDSNYSFGEWQKAVSQFLALYLVVQLVKNKSQIYSIFVSGGLGIVILCLIESIYFFVFGNEPDNRAGVLTGASQWFSVYIVMGLPILWIAWEMSEKNKRLNQILFALGLGIVLVGLFLSHTRSAWLVVGVQVFIYAFLKIRRNWSLSFGLAGVLVGLLLVVLSLPSVVGQKATSMQTRFNTWSIAIQDIAKSPVTGIGLGKHSFSKFHGYQDLGSGVGSRVTLQGSPSMQPYDVHTNLHNTFIARAVQTGIPGFLFYISIFVTVLIKAGQMFQRFQDELDGKLSLAIGLIVVGVIVRNFFDDMFNGTTAYLFWIFVGLFFSLGNIVKPQKLARFGVCGQN